MPTYEYTSKGSVGDYSIRICMWTYLTFCFTVAQLLLTFAVWSKWSTFVVLYVSQYSHALSTKQKNIKLINVLFCWNEWAPTFIFVFYFWSGVGEILTVWLNICTVHNSLSMFYVEQTIHTRRQEIGPVLGIILWWLNKQLGLSAASCLIRACEPESSSILFFFK